MTKKEREHIKKRIIQFGEWKKKEEKEAEQSYSEEERKEHRHQAELNETIADAYLTLLLELNDMRKK